MPVLKSWCGLLKLVAGQNKHDTIERLLIFLLCPSQQEKKETKKHTEKPSGK